ASSESRSASRCSPGWPFVFASEGCQSGHAGLTSSAWAWWRESASPSLCSWQLWRSTILAWATSPRSESSPDPSSPPSSAPWFSCRLKTPFRRPTQSPPPFPRELPRHHHLCRLWRGLSSDHVPSRRRASRAGDGADVSLHGLQLSLGQRVGVGGMSVGTELDAVVIGSGPNGLAAAITIAREGGSVLIVEAADTIGGGLHSAELTLPGLTHDLCSTIHTLGAGSPFMRSLPLEEYGVEWVHPEVLLAHPVSPSEAGLLHRSVDATADGLGPDADRYRSLVGTVVERWEHLEENVLGPILSWPRHPVDLVRFGLRAMLPMTTTAARMKTEKAAALLAGCAAHAFLPLTRPFTTAFALTLTATGHRYGWPFVRGGSQALANAMARYLEDLGGKIETGRRIEDLAELPRSRVVLADVSPPSLARLLEGRVPETFLRRYRRFRPSPGAFKVDYALTEPVPWSN